MILIYFYVRISKHHGHFGHEKDNTFSINNILKLHCLMSHVNIFLRTSMKHGNIALEDIIKNIVK